MFEILKNKKIFLIGSIVALAAAGFYFWKKKKLVGNSKLIFKKISFKNKKFNLVFKIQNPTNATGTISSLTGEVYVNGKQIADFSNFGEQKIQPNSESTLNIVAQPSGGLINLLLSKGWLKPGVTYTIKGRGNFDGITAPFEFSSKLF